MNRWRTGTKVPINVYDGNRPVCQCHTATDARRIVKAVNYLTGTCTHTRVNKDGICRSCGHGRLVRGSDDG